jgi:hypothetical protein
MYMGVYFFIYHYFYWLIPISRKTCFILNACNPKQFLPIPLTLTFRGLNLTGFGLFDDTVSQHSSIRLNREPIIYGHHPSCCALHTGQAITTFQSHVVLDNLDKPALLLADW